MSSVELTPVTLPGYIDQVASKYGLDPAAVLAVAHQEGLGGGIGDGGTSFGPFQLHAGGALPQQEYQGPNSPQTQQWAWSADGVNYALAQMQQSAEGLAGAAAIEAIVTEFERPKNPSAEIAGAEAAYPQYAGGTSTGAATPNLGISSSNTLQNASLTSGAAGLLGGVTSTGTELLLRLLFVVGGIVFGALALILLVRKFTGVSVPKAAVGAVAVVEGRKELQAARQRTAVRETRAGEAHTSKIALQTARTKTEGARATELRTRTKHRAATASKSRKQQEAHDKRMMLEGAIASEQARGQGRMSDE